LSRRVVITGIGLVTPLGVGTRATWSALCQGKSGIKEISRFDASGFSTRIAGEVSGFDPADFMSKKEARRSQPFISYAIAASRMALEDAGFVIDSGNANRVGVITGCALGGLSSLEDAIHIIQEKGPKKLSPFFLPMLIGNMAPGMISIHLGAKGPNSSIATACAAGSHAIGDAFHIIKRGQADAMITGGMESMITPTCVAGFNALKALSTRNNEPEKASRPFDRDRDGFVLGEGAGILVLETLESALSRGASVYAEVCGYGMSGDGHHITAPPPDGDGAVRCMQAALSDAGMHYSDIDYINAHGTGTQLNDPSETTALKRVFNEKASAIPVSSTKSMTGHLLGAAGGIETAFTALTISTGVIAPTINLEHPDEACDLDYVPRMARKQTVRSAMTNSFGFGGTNATLILKKVDG
jgi:3-oxoacyl-[acyl-carrier-protein] synthase II